MRLLNATTKRLESFYGDYIPSYAILSHMWGKEEDEVLFKHVAGSDDDRREGKGRKGYAKLLAACEQAISDKWKYIWIDTCCIDKQSSAELSEAINSMYAWYRASEVCYAYLEDVRSDMETRGWGDTFEIVPFVESRWFKRGWTLQELIAPRRVVFYSSDWIDIGTKASLRGVISAITDIRVEMITNYDPDQASVAEKMSWAAKRKTTRDEDIAYCLVGLLGVNMPLLYGEGMRAFRRLQEEIIKISDDHSIFAWKKNRYDYLINSDLIRETRGMLADSPWNFIGAGNVVRSSDDGPYPSYSISNKGLQIGLPIRLINPEEELIGADSVDIDSQNIFKAILNCTYRDTSPTRWVVIYLKMIGSGRYVRIFPYWLDETEMNPNEAERHGSVVTSLLVPQVNTSKTSLFNPDILLLNVLPTGSGYSLKGDNLVKGWEVFRANLLMGIFIFDREGECFGVVVGRNNGIVWMDIITEDDFGCELSLTNEHNITDKIKSFYEEGGPKNYVVLQHLSFPCVNVSKDYSVDLSGKMVLDSKLGYEITIDIRRITTRASIVTHTTENFLDDLDLRSVHANSKKEGFDWFAIFNPKIKRVLDVSLVHSLGDENSRTRLVTTLFSPDGKYLATATKNTIQVYNTTTYSTICVLSDKSIPQLVNICALCFSPTSNFLAVGTCDGHVLLWDIIEKHVFRDFTTHRSRIKALKFSPDNRLIISVPGHGMVRILDIDNGTAEDVCDLGHETLFSVAISPSTRFIAGVQGVIIRIWDLETKELVEELQGYNRDMNCISFTPDEKGLVSGSKDNTLKYWRIGGPTATGVKWRKNNGLHIPVRKDVDQSIQCVMDIKHKFTVSEVAVSYDGNWLISVSGGKMLFWNLRNGIVQFMLRSRTSEIHSLNMNPVGNTFAICTDQNRVQIWKYSDNIEAMDQS